MVGSRPRLFVIVDEFSDLIISDREFFEDAFEKISAVSDRTGIFLILASSKAVEDVFTQKLRHGRFERVAFRVSSVEDSVLIIGESGAEELVKPGSCLVGIRVDEDVWKAL